MMRRTCPHCSKALYGGPVRFWCMDGHSASAADLYYEYDEITDPQVEQQARRSRAYGRAS